LDDDLCRNASANTSNTKGIPRPPRSAWQAEEWQMKRQRGFASKNGRDRIGPASALFLVGSLLTGYAIGAEPAEIDCRDDAV
jgi:hypothetical protein